MRVSNFYKISNSQVWKIQENIRAQEVEVHVGNIQLQCVLANYSISLVKDISLYILGF